MNRISSLKRSDMAVLARGITQFYLPFTHKPHLALLPSHKASLPDLGTFSILLITGITNICGNFYWNAITK